jgi:hypothetical protein
MIAAITITFEGLVVTGALIVSMTTNVLLLRHHERATNALLARVQSNTKLVLGPTMATSPHTPEERLYIADHEADDEAWNDYRGEPAETETEDATT